MFDPTKTKKKDSKVGAYFLYYIFVEKVNLQINTKL